jgi:choice-of-anchor B domain-containing protein
MKRLLLMAMLLSSFASLAQVVYDSKNISLLSISNPNTGTLSGSVGNRYSGCWGWYQANKQREYAISGASNGTYFIDITNPAAPVVCDSLAGTVSTWREMKTFQHYCYIVSDYVTPNKFQIVDLQYLPDSIHVVHNSNVLFELGHTIFIDKDKMYVGSTRFGGLSAQFSWMTIWSLATPTAPVLIRRMEQDTLSVGKVHEIHDMYVRNDTIYASAGWHGLRIMKLKSDSTLQLLGTYDGYPQEGYNHSSWLTKNGKYLLFTDEVPESLPMNFIDVSNMGNMQPVKQFKPYEKTTPHNPYIIGNDFAVVSCYQDGLQIYDISDPHNIVIAGYFDTYPQGGNNTGNYGVNAAYRGNWGAYPYLPSGVIIANDMQNGVFLLDARVAYTVGISENPQTSSLMMFPNPASDKLNIYLNSTAQHDIQITNSLGQVISNYSVESQKNVRLDVSTLQSGSYIVTVNNNAGVLRKKIIIAH